MKIISIELSSRYKKSFRRIPSRIQRRAILKIRIFSENPFNSCLKTHPLSGKDKECWAFGIDFHYRIKFIFLNDKEVLFLDIGNHDIYK